MIKILIIEYLEHRLERKEFWEKIDQNYRGQPGIEFVICPQEREKEEDEEYLRKSGLPLALNDYQLVFIHKEDRLYSLKGDYVDLAQNMSFVLYSGGATEIDSTSIDKCQIGLLPFSTLKNNAIAFFNEILRSGKITSNAFYLLAGIDPRREAAISLLQHFLPLDVELQLGDLVKCQEQAKLLIEKDEVENLTTKLLDQIYPANAAQNTQVTNPELELSFKLKNRLITLARGIVTPGNNSLDLIFGYQVDENGGVNRHDASNLREEGFHRTFEKLRDTLLER